MKTLTDLLNETEEHFRSLNHSRYTIRTLHYNCLAFIRYLNENHKVNEASGLRKEHLFSYQRHLAHRRTAKGLPLKPRSINKRIENVRVFLKLLAKKGYILESVSEILNYVKEPKMLPVGILTHAQIKRLLRTIDGNTPEGRRNRAILELMYSSGLRAGEIVGLDLGHVDFNYSTVRVFGKGRKERIVPVGETALRHLQTYIMAVRPFLHRNTMECSALFLNSDRGRLRYHTLLKMVHECCAKAKITEKVSCHTFRRSCTTELIRGGANIYHVKEMLGHESLETLKHYTKLTINDLRKTHAKCHPRARDSFMKPGKKLI